MINNLRGKSMSSAMKALVARCGSYLSTRTATKLSNAVQTLQTSRWIIDNNYANHVVHARREGLYDQMISHAGGRLPLYLEFGVFTGGATRWFSKGLKNPNARLIGFDTFEGLPEDWNTTYKKGHFSTDGRVPDIDDPRVSFEVGLFQDTLEQFTVPQHEVLLLNMDADLFSSTTYVLGKLRDEIRVGTLIYFDEFSDFEHERRAFDDLRAETGWRFDLLGVTKDLRHALFERTS